MSEALPGRPLGSMISSLAEHRPSGLLTQTVIPSPVIRWMIPARLRSKEHNDVIFIGDKRLQIKEVVNGHLEDVVEKTDFDASILGAKVINVSDHLPLDVQMRTAASAGALGIDSDRLPPQLLLLSVDMKELLFLYRSIANPSYFVTYHRPLPSDVSLPEKFGRHIAVDPKSRGVAVSASNDYFGVFWLRFPHELQQQMQKGLLDPVVTEHFYKLDGDILFMEFLYPTSAEDKNIILLLIVVQDGAARAVLYRWNEKNYLHRSRPKIEQIPLQQQDKLPTMVVPLTKESSFLLFTTTSMTIYSVNTSSRPRQKYPLILPSPEPGRPGLWTRWARPLRNWEYTQKYDGIYLCREDGWIYYLEFGNEGALENQTDLGQLHCDVDTAFDVLDMDEEGGDFILAAGSMGDGGLFVQKARDHPRCVQQFLNWAPVTDAVVIPSESNGPLERDMAHDRLFVCSTSASGSGSLTELRYGVESQIVVAVSMDEQSQIRDMWSAGVNGDTYVMISDPVSSHLLHMSSDLEGEISAIDEADTGLSTAETLAAGFTADGVFIQVTESATHLFATNRLAINNCISHEPYHNIMSATVDGPSSMVATAMRNESAMVLHLSRIVTSDDAVTLTQIGSPVELDTEPVCLSIQTFRDTSFIFMGTGDGTVLVFHIDNETIKFLFHTVISIPTEEDTSKAIESIAAIRTLYGGKGLHVLLFCGLRSGILVPFEVDFNAVSLLSLKQKGSRQIGKTSIRLQGKGSFALFTCGDEFWRVSYTEDDSPPGYFLWRIWITEASNPSYFPVTFNSFALIYSHSDSSFESDLGSLFCFADGQLLICTLEQRAKTVARRIGLPGKPSRLTYSKHLQSLIIAYSVANKDPLAHPFDRDERYCIEFVDPDSQHSVVHRGRSGIEACAETWRPQGSRGEKITCIFDWTPKRDGNEYHLIVIGTSSPGCQAGDGPRGRIILVQGSRRPTDPSRMDCYFQYAQEMPGPVRAIAPYGDSLLVAVGNRILPLISSNTSTRWLRDIKLTLPSPAIAITVQEQYVYITTSRHSLMVYEFLNKELVPRALDTIARDGLSHSLVTRSPNLLFASSRGGSVRLYTDPTGSPSGRALGLPACEANLRLSVSRLLPGSRILPLSQGGSMMYGLALDGTVYRFLALDRNEWRLLRLLQSLCEKDIALNPSFARRERRVDLSTIVGDMRDPDHGHLNGDMLARLAETDDEYLHDMIQEEMNSLSGSAVQTFEGAFHELAETVLGVRYRHEEAVMSWLRQVLHVEL